MPTMRVAVNVFHERLTGWDFATRTRARNTASRVHVKAAVKKYCRRAATAVQAACRESNRD